MVIQKIVTLSTAHITEETFKYLDDGQIYPISFSNNGNGFGVVVRVLEEDLSDEDLYMMPDLIDCIRFARQIDCDYIRFDSDAEKYAELKTYDW